MYEEIDDLLHILKIQRFSTQDGPGIRTTVFMKGCPLRCIWCHNPESQSDHPEIFYTPSLCIECRTCADVCSVSAHSFLNGKHDFDRTECTLCLDCCQKCPTKALEPVSERMSVSQILDAVNKDICFYGTCGGLTLSGGEPMLQAVNVLKLLKRAKENGLNTVMETCGFFDEKYIASLVSITDLLLWDLKCADPVTHKKFTGVSNEQILQNLYAFDRLGGKTVLRCIMLQGINTDDASIQKIVGIYRTLKNCQRVEIFSYRHHAENKYMILGRQYMGLKDWALSPNQLKDICSFLNQNAVRCRMI